MIVNYNNSPYVSRHESYHGLVPLRARQWGNAARANLRWAAAASSSVMRWRAKHRCMLGDGERAGIPRPGGVSRPSRVAAYETVPLGKGYCHAARYRWARGVACLGAVRSSPKLAPRVMTCPPIKRRRAGDDTGAADPPAVDPRILCNTARHPNQPSPRCDTVIVCREIATWVAQQLQSAHNRLRPSVVGRGIGDHAASRHGDRSGFEGQAPL